MFSTYDFHNVQPGVLQAFGVACVIAGFIGWIVSGFVFGHGWELGIGDWVLGIGR